MGGGGKSEVNGTHPSVCALLPRTTKRNLRKHSFIVCSVYSRNNPPAAKCLSARQTSTQSPQKPSPASVTIVTGHRCRPVLINVHGTPSCLIEVLLHPTRSPYGLKLRDSGRCLEFWNKSRSARGGGSTEEAPYLLNSLHQRIPLLLATLLFGSLPF